MSSVRFEGTAEMVHFLLQQRTEYKVFSTSGLHVEAIMQEYCEDMRGIYQSVRGFIPETASAIMDIGGGLGGMSVMLANHYGPHTFINILEREGDVGSKIGWHDAAEDFGSYNSSELTEHFLNANGVVNYFVHDAANGFPAAAPLQLVISLLSMGFHYPVETYLDAIYESLDPGGVLVCDFRKGQSGVGACRDKFNCTPMLLREGEKHATMGFRKC